MDDGGGDVAEGDWPEGPNPLNREVTWRKMIGLKALRPQGDVAEDDWPRALSPKPLNREVMCWKVIGPRA